MLIRPQRPWNLPESAATPESVYLDRRRILKGMGLGGIALAGAGAGISGFAPRSAHAVPIEGFPAPTNPEFAELDRALTAEKEATTYTNFYEFGSSKNIWKAAKRMRVDPWTIRIDGMVEKRRGIDAGKLIREVGGMEERLYRHRCVEAWAMAVPWTGVPFSKIVDFARPSAGAKYVRMETFLNPDEAPGQRQQWYPWPYVEGMTIEEARNELAFLATGIYGKPLPNQNGAPVRLVLPWKYGFKSIKSIARITFTDKRPKSFWEHLQPREYGFWANVNPEVPHPRWSQATERMLGERGRVPTLKYNGYGQWVESLYKDLPQDRSLFF